MKKFGNYLRNTPPKKKRRTKKRGARRNPAPFALTAINPAKRTHKKRRANPVKRKRARKNPLEIQHVIAAVPARNPSRRKTRRKALSKSSHRNPMSKKRKRRNRSRNPVSHTRRRSHRRSRNPSRRRRARRSGIMSRLRNPAIVSDVLNRKNIETGLGVLTGVVGTRWLVNKLIQGDPVTGVRMFDLPGITYSTATAPLTQAQFSAKNKWMLAFYETAIPAVAGWLLRNKASALSEGLMQSAIVNVGIAAIRGTSVGTAAGMNAFLPRQRGMQTYIPGVPPMLTGPATAFIGNGAPVPARMGMSAAVNRSWHARTVTGVANPFAK